MTHALGCRLFQVVIINAAYRMFFQHRTLRPFHLLISLLLLLVVAACKPGLSPDSGADAVDSPRIISLAPSITEMIFALEAGDQLVGRSMHCKHPPAAATIESVGRIDLPDVEKILLLAPDSVILSGLTPLEVEQRLKKLNLQTLRLEHSGLDGLRGDIETLAKHLGRQQAGDRLLDYWDATIAGVQSAVAEKQTTPPRVLLLYSMNALYSAGKGSFVGDLISLCGGDNIAKDAISPWPQLNRESVLAANPEVILLALGDKNRSETDRSEFIAQLQADAYWGHIEAVRNHRIHFIPADWLTVPGPRTLNAIEAIFSAIHQ
jgi:iron complex transport system substrate-binding protein